MLSSKKLTCKGTQRHVFNQSLQTGYSQSYWHFRPNFVTYCPLTLQVQGKYNMYRQCVAGRVWGRRGCSVLLGTIFSTTYKIARPPQTITQKRRGPQTDKSLPQSLFTGKFFQMTTFCIAFYRSNLSMVYSISACFPFPSLCLDEQQESGRD